MRGIARRLDNKPCEIEIFRQAPARRDPAKMDAISSWNSA
jgi:hypothetical protein